MRPEALDDLGQTISKTWPVDAASDTMLARIREAAPFDLLVNNLGMARHAPLTETPDADIDTVLDLNIRATLRITRRDCRPHDIRRERRHHHLPDGPCRQPGARWSIAPPNTRWRA